MDDSGHLDHGIRSPKIHLEPDVTVTDIRSRLRFTEHRMERNPSGRCQARVVLTWPNAEFVGEADGLSSPAGELRCSAEACLAAINRAVPDFGLQLVGVKSVRAFDAVVVIASVTGRGIMNGQRMVGSALVQEDYARGAALAVLNATNRFLSGGGRT